MNSLFIFLSSLLNIGTFQDQQLPNPAQVQSIISEKFSGFQDLQFTYEGEDAYLAQDGSPVTKDHFQGHYAYVARQATRLEFYVNVEVRGDITGFEHETHLLRGSELLSLTETAEIFSRAPVIKSKGAPGVLLRPHTPEFFVYHWYFSTIKDYAALECQALRWEVLDGHQCLVIKLNGGDRPPGFKDSLNTRTFWIDLEHGGHPRRVEYRDFHGELTRLVERVRIERYPLANGQSVWFPIRAEQRTFQGDGFVSKTPTMSGWAGVVNGSLRFNSNLSANRLSIEQNPSPSSPVLAKAKRDFQAQRKIAPVPKTDPESVSQRIEQQLADAKSQAEMMEANAPSRRFWTGTTIWQLLLFGMGTAVIVGAILSVRKGR